MEALEKSPRILKWWYILLHFCNYPSYKKCNGFIFCFSWTGVSLPSPIFFWNPWCDSWKLGTPFAWALSIQNHILDFVDGSNHYKRKFLNSLCFLPRDLKQTWFNVFRCTPSLFHPPFLIQDHAFFPRDLNHFSVFLYPTASLCHQLFLEEVLFSSQEFLIF